MATEEQKEMEEKAITEERHFLDRPTPKAPSNPDDDNDDDNEYDEDEQADEDSLQNKIDSREFRRGLVCVILLLWASLMLPYDIEGSIIHGDYVRHIGLFLAALYLWLIAHLCCILCCLLSLFTLKWCTTNNVLNTFQLLLIFTASCLQVIGAILFAYSYCVNQDYLEDSPIWAACICKSHGLYLLYNAGFIAYLGLILFASKYRGTVPLLSLILDKRCFSDSDDDGNVTVKFSKNFRITYLALIATVAMSLILVYGFNIYGEVGESYQAIYIGYLFMLTATSLTVLIQLLFHCRVCTKWCNARKKRQSSNAEAVEQETNLLANRPNTVVRKIRGHRVRKGRAVESVLKLIVYFLIFAGIVMIFMYSVVSKIPEAEIVVERLRLVGNMIIITGTGVQLSYELFTKRDDYDGEPKVVHKYALIPDQAL